MSTKTRSYIIIFLLGVLAVLLIGNLVKGNEKTEVVETPTVEEIPTPREPEEIRVIVIDQKEVPLYPNKQLVEIKVDAEDTWISKEIQEACVRIGYERGYCPELLMAIIEKESSGRQYVENGPCKGLMQINTSCQEVTDEMERRGYTDIFDIETNILMGCYVLDLKQEIFGDNLYAVLMGYNGSSNVKDRVARQDYTDYAIYVVDRTWELERLHTK